eukprot:714476-Hanusia_phi.AAC.1
MLSPSPSPPLPPSSQSPHHQSSDFPLLPGLPLPLPPPRPHLTPSPSSSSDGQSAASSEERLCLARSARTSCWRHQVSVSLASLPPRNPPLLPAVGDATLMALEGFDDLI